MTESAFAAIVAGLDAPLIVVTAAMGDERAGCLVGFHTQSSISPQRYSVWLSKANHTYRVASRATHFGIHFLSQDQLAMAEHFGTLTGDTTDKFAGLRSQRGAHGVPVLLDCLHRLILRRTAILAWRLVVDHQALQPQTLVGKALAQHRLVRFHPRADRR